MNSPVRQDARVCPQCGAALSATATQCWLCRGKVDRQAATSPRDVPPPQTTPTTEHPAVQFGLASLMLTITLISVCLGVMSMAPGLGILFAIFVTPAFVRTVMAAGRRRMTGQSMDVGEKLLAFAGSVGVVTIIGVAAGAAFYATCWVGFVGGMVAGTAAGAKGYDPIGWGLLTGVGIGIVIGIYVAYRVARRLWQRKE